MFTATAPIRGNFNLSGPPVQGFAIANGDEGIRQTCRFIRHQIDLGKRDPLVIQTFKQIAAETNTSSKTQLSQALTHWAVQNIQYVHDDDMSMTEKGLQWVNIKKCPLVFKRCEPVEMLRTAHQILEEKREDCDGFCIILGAFHELGGMPVKMVTVALDPTDKTQFSHVYLIVNIDGQWIPVDAVNKQQPWGWEVPNPYRREILC